MWHRISFCKKGIRTTDTAALTHPDKAKGNFVFDENYSTN